MRLVAILVLCLAITVQTRAEPFIFDIISQGAQAAGSIAEGAIGAVGSAANGIVQAANGIAQGAVNAATGIGKGVIGVGSDVISNLGNVASSFGKAISDGINGIRSSVLKRVLQQVQNTLQSIQNASRGALQAYEQAAKNVKERVIELEEKQQEDIEAWADKVKNKLANSTEDAQIRGQDLIDEFANKRTEELKECTDDVIGQLEQLQEKANSTAERFHEPMNKLIQHVAMCSELKANDYKGLASCNADIRDDLRLSAAAPGRLGVVKAQIVRVGLTNLRKNVCVKLALKRFREEASRVDKQIDQLVADDKKKVEEEHVDETSPAADTTPSADEPGTSPANDESEQ